MTVLSVKLRAEQELKDLLGTAYSSRLLDRISERNIYIETQPLVDNYIKVHTRRFGWQDVIRRRDEGLNIMATFGS